jgi:Fur family ferric uptake transcriptional regulator
MCRNFNILVAMSSNELYLKKLKETGNSNTVIRSAVFGTLLDSEHTPLTMAELIRRTADYGDRASVYRSVTVLEEIGVIKRLNIGWKYKLELSEEFHGHHHHITCEKCGRTESLTDENLEEVIKSSAQKADYKITDHTIEIKGVCADCKSSK